MNERTVSIPNISCHHCVMTITRELGDLDGVTSVSGDPETKQITVRWDESATWEDITALLDEIGYPVEA